MVRIPDKIHEELLNWARWCWIGEWPHPLPATHCGSLESGYRPPPYWNPEDEAEESMRRSAIRPNERHAKRVQSVFEGLPSFGRLVMKSEYPCRAERGSRASAAHRIGLTERQYENHLEIVIMKVEAEFAVCA
jgi:hypothetical protein